MVMGSVIFTATPCAAQDAPTQAARSAPVSRPGCPGCCDRLTAHVPVGLRRSPGVRGGGCGEPVGDLGRVEACEATDLVVRDAPFGDEASDVTDADPEPGGEGWGVDERRELGVVHLVLTCDSAVRAAQTRSVTLYTVPTWG